MTTTSQTFSPDVNVFVPRGINHHASLPDHNAACFTPQATSFVPSKPSLQQFQAQQQYGATSRMDSFGDYVRHAPANNLNGTGQQYFNQGTPIFNHQSAQKLQQPAQMPMVQMNFSAPLKAHGFQRQPSFAKEQTPFYPDFASTLGQRPRTHKNLFTPLSMMHSKSGLQCDARSAQTQSTHESSNGDSHSTYSDDENCMESFENGFESPNQRLNRKYSHMTASNSKMVVNENGWKKKVKTELCRFWLQGQDCENSQKEQGCGFAHGQDELQKKKGLSRQYLTSVCKNFLEHPSKCTYGQRCIFQHPTHDVRTRQPYTKMMQDNTRYTAMRLFQDIEGSDVLYINTYAATTPRLAAFKPICSSAKDNGEDYVDASADEHVAKSANFSRDLFRIGSQC